MKEFLGNYGIFILLGLMLIVMVTRRGGGCCGVGGQHHKATKDSTEKKVGDHGSCCH